MFETQSIGPNFNFDIVLSEHEQSCLHTELQDEFPDDILLREQDIVCYSSRGSHKQNNDKFDFIAKNDFVLAAVYDGHGDSTVSLYLKENLLKDIENHPKFSSNPVQSIHQCIKHIEQRVVKRFDSTSGSTLMIVLWKKNGVIVANVGDGLCYGFKKEDEQIFEIETEETQSYEKRKQIQNKRFQLNQIHNLDVESERKKIRSNGGAIFKLKNSYRVAGELNLSRSIGDRKYKKWISAVPSIKLYQTQFSHIILATDGFSKTLQFIEQPNLLYNLVENGSYLKDNSTFILLKKPSHFN